MSAAKWTGSARNNLSGVTSWTAEEDAMLRVLWPQGLSASEISKHIRGRTRNSVIGRVHRLKLEGRESPLSPVQAAAAHEPAPKPKARRQRVVRSDAETRPPKSAKPFDLSKSRSDSTPEQRASNSAAGKTLIKRTVDPANDNAVPLLERRFGQCAWPVGHPVRPALQLCCGAAVAENANRSVASYCTAHAERAVARVLAGGKPDPDRYERAMRRWAA